MSIQETPSANRLHIAIYGRRNAGKSSLMNALTGQQTAVVSEIAGTTTDLVKKAMEVRGLGACVLIDTAGFDDEGELGSLRMQKTRESIAQAEIAILVLSTEENEEEWSLEEQWNKDLQQAGVRTVLVLNQVDKGFDTSKIAKIKERFGVCPLPVSARTGEGIPELLEALVKAMPEGNKEQTILGNLVKAGDLVMLVMPQDAEAPKGRLILPQVQTIRELLDRKCISMNVTPETMEGALAALKKAPDLIVTDSQVFAQVYEKTPKESRLTSFSVLFAAYKGDAKVFREGAEVIDQLGENAKILIAEACTHAPLTEDIGRVKIPALLRKRLGEGVQIDVRGGVDFPKNLAQYDLIVHCGGCMFHRKYLLSRIESAKRAGVPITNYGILIAKLSGILDRVTLPESSE
ncbi:MAG: [FeFe] hydrogenase H-cluster maturation GTPase HydF [bacterium]|nr:[FeFe] hydrogenase H-cluster maturation GTPase HydF [bacterium]